MSVTAPFNAPTQATDALNVPVPNGDIVVAGQQQAAPPQSWRDRYQKGSFRGVAFISERHDFAGGRRVVTHEFPGRDEPVTEDLGRRARSFQLDCHVLGADYMTARDALLDALEEEGAGLLIHPWRGAMMVNVLDFSQSESTDEGGFASFSVEFGEAGVAVEQSAPVDGAGAALATADAVTEEAIAAFPLGFDVEGVAEFVEENAAQIIKGAASATALLAAVQQGGVGPALRAFEMGLALLPTEVGGLLRAPLQLAHSVVGLVSAVGALGSPIQRIETLLGMAGHGRNEDYLTPRTPARQREADNREAILHLLSAASMAEVVRQLGIVPLPSHDDAAALRVRIAGRLDDLALVAADAGDDDRADQFDRLRRAVVQIVDARAGNLARLYDHIPARSEPALVIANRLYGHTDVEARAIDILARNFVRHPAFVPAGEVLKVVAA